MKLFKQILLTISLCFLFFIITDASVCASVKINRTNKTMYIDNTYILKVTGTKQYILWKSSDKKIASVTKKGKVTAKRVGTCTITATVGSGMDNKKLSCVINVKSKLSCNDTIIKCYKDEYESVRIETKNLSKYENLVIEEENNKIAYAEWDYNSDYFDMIIIPKKLGITRIKVSRVNNIETFSGSENDFITFLIICYPDRSGWLGIPNLKYYNLVLTSNSSLVYEHIGISGTSLNGFVDVTVFELNPDTDIKEDDGTYISNGLQYKIINDEDFYFSTKGLEDIIFCNLLESP